MGVISLRLKSKQEASAAFVFMLKLDSLSSTIAVLNISFSTHSLDVFLTKNVNAHRENILLFYIVRRVLNVLMIKNPQQGIIP